MQILWCFKSEFCYNFFFCILQKNKAIKKQKGGYSRNVKKKELEKRVISPPYELQLKENNDEVKNKLMW